MNLKRLTTISLSICLFQFSVLGQSFKLKSARHGLDLILKSNVSKDSIINDTRFADGKDDIVDILRFDNVGEIHGSDIVFIISSKLPVPSDSIGLNPLKLEKDTLKSLLNLIQELDTKIYKRPSGSISFRMTYRFDGTLFQYFIGGGKESTEYFKKIERRIVTMDNQDALKRFHHFLWTSTLLKKRTDGYQTYSPRGQIQWVHEKN
jgi:hypothetical protein